MDFYLFLKNTFVRKLNYKTMKPLLIILFSFFFANFNYAVTPNEDYAKASKIVAKHLDSIIFEEAINNDTSIKINLIVNENFEITVLTVDTHSNSIRRSIKSTLNNKKVGTGDLIPGKEYSFVLDVKAN